MGQAQTMPSYYPKEPTAVARTVANWKTGYRQVTPPITSGPEIRKEPYMGGERWGPYKKQYVKPFLGTTPLFVPPETVDGLPLLCECSKIEEWMKNSTSDLALMFAKTPPACWQDESNLLNPWGGPTFDVYVRHPGFYVQAAYSFLGGRKTRKRMRKRRRLSRRTRKRVA